MYILEQHFLVSGIVQSKLVYILSIYWFTYISACTLPKVNVDVGRYTVVFVCEQDEEEGMEAEFEGVIHGVIDSEKAGAEEKAKEKLGPRSVDAYWLQRELNKFFKDPIVSLVDMNAIPLYQWA